MLLERWDLAYLTVEGYNSIDFVDLYQIAWQTFHRVSTIWHFVSDGKLTTQIAIRCWANVGNGHQRWHQFANIGNPTNDPKWLANGWAANIVLPT